MDVAYDHIQEEALVPDHDRDDSQPGNGGGLNEEFQEAFRAVSASPWGAKLGGFFGQLKSQGESLYTEAQKEVAAASSHATERLTDLAQRARRLSLTQPGAPDASAASFSDPNFVLPSSGAKPAPAPSSEERSDSLPADIVKEATTLVSRFRSEAAARLAHVRQAEDAADAALLRFGTNMRDFLQSAVSVSAPQEGDKGEVLFETSGDDGKRVFHSNRFEARLHAIHSRAESFVSDPEGEEWDAWKEGFSVDKETGRIAGDLERYDELRKAMERLVPEKVKYGDFWQRYYFLRMVVDVEEKKRKEVLKGAIADEEVGWGDDDEDEEDGESSTPTVAINPVERSQPASQSTTTLVPAATEPAVAPQQHLSAAIDGKPRGSHDEDKKSSSADSDASYDIVSGATSKAPGSPKVGAEVEGRKEDSDDEDWE